MRRWLIVMVLAAASTACGPAEDPIERVTVPFPQGVGEQALHCVRALSVSQLRFEEIARDTLPDGFAARIAESRENDFEPALRAASNAAFNAGAFDLDTMFDRARNEAALRAWIAPFGEDAVEFNRHVETCLNLYGPVKDQNAGS